MKMKGSDISNKMQNKYQRFTVEFFFDFENP